MRFCILETVVSRDPHNNNIIIIIIIIIKRKQKRIRVQLTPETNSHRESKVKTTQLQKKNCTENSRTCLKPKTESMIDKRTINQKGYITNQILHCS